MPSGTSIPSESLEFHFAETSAPAVTAPISIVATGLGSFQRWILILAVPLKPVRNVHSMFKESGAPSFVTVNSESGRTLPIFHTPPINEGEFRGPFVASPICEYWLFPHPRMDPSSMTMRLWLDAEIPTIEPAISGAGVS